MEYMSKRKGLSGACRNLIIAYIHFIGSKKSHSQRSIEQSELGRGNFLKEEEKCPHIDGP